MITGKRVTRDREQRSERFSLPDAHSTETETNVALRRGKSETRNARVKNCGDRVCAWTQRLSFFSSDCSFFFFFHTMKGEKSAREKKEQNFLSSPTDKYFSTCRAAQRCNPASIECNGRGTPTRYGASLIMLAPFSGYYYFKGRDDERHR